MSNRIITSWNVKSGNLYEFGTTTFNSSKIRKMNSEGREAIRLLSEKILETEKCSKLATEAYRVNKRLITAVAFSEEKGLRVKLNGEEHHIAKADQVYQGLVPGLKEIKKIQAIAERRALIPVEKTEEKAVRVFHDMLTRRADEMEAPTLVDRAGILKGDETPLVQKACKVAFIWKAILFLTGLEVMMTAFNNMVASLTNQNHLEKFFLSCANLLEGMATLGTAVIFLMQRVSSLTKNFVTKAAAGAAFPVTMFILYGSILVAAIYRLFVQLKFRYELNTILGDKSEKELKETLIWLKQQTQLSSIETKEHSDDGLIAAVQRKWEAFSLRVEEGMIDEIIDPEKLDMLIEKFDSTAAKELIERVQDANSRAMLWTLGSMFMNTLGLVATGLYIGALGHVHAGVITSLYVLAAAGALLTDSPKLRLQFFHKLRQLRAQFFQWLRENCECVKSEDQGLEQDLRSELSYEPDEVLPLDRRGLQQDPCSTTSSTSYAPNGACLQTPLRLTAATLHVLQPS